MNVRVHVREAGTHRSYVDFHWYRIALPVQVSVSTSFFPGPDATTDLDHRWITQRVLNITVLWWTLRVVVVGPLFTDDEIE